MWIWDCYTTCGQLMVCQTLLACLLPNYRQHTFNRAYFFVTVQQLSFKQSNVCSTTAVLLQLPLPICPGVWMWHLRTHTCSFFLCSATLSPSLWCQLFVTGKFSWATFSWVVWPTEIKYDDNLTPKKFIMKISSCTVWEVLKWIECPVLYHGQYHV